MYGEKSIIYRGTLLIDNQGRITLPTMLEAEAHDKIVWVRDEKHNAYKLYNYEKVAEILDKMSLENQIAQSNSVEELNGKDEILINFCENIVHVCSVDVARKISSKQLLIGYDSVELIGCGDFLLLKPMVKSIDDNNHIKR